MDEMLDIETPVVPKTFDQLGILVLDGSASMDEEAENKMTKAETVSSSISDLINRLKASKNKKNFSLAMVTFDTTANIHTDITPVVDIDQLADYNPVKGHGGNTEIGVGLAVAQQIADRFLSDRGTSLKKSVVVIIMSDGASRKEDEALKAGARLKDNPNVTVCSTLFARKGENDEEARNLLRQLASDPVTLYQTVYDAETLRNFFLNSVTEAPARKRRKEQG